MKPQIIILVTLLFSYQAMAQCGNGEKSDFYKVKKGEELIVFDLYRSVNDGRKHTPLFYRGGADVSGWLIIAIKSLPGKLIGESFEGKNINEVISVSIISDNSSSVNTIRLAIDPIPLKSSDMENYFKFNFPISKLKDGHYSFILKILQLKDTKTIRYFNGNKIPFIVKTPITQTEKEDAIVSHVLMEENAHLWDDTPYDNAINTYVIGILRGKKVHKPNNISILLHYIAESKRRLKKFTEASAWLLCAYRFGDADKNMGKIKTPNYWMLSRRLAFYMNNNRTLNKNGKIDKLADKIYSQYLSYLKPTFSWTEINVRLLSQRNGHERDHHDEVEK